MEPILGVEARQVGALASRRGQAGERSRLWQKLSWLVALLGLALGCGQVRLVGPYDEQVDTGTSDVHTEIASFVQKMDSAAGKPEGAYAANASFYADLSAKVSTLKLRAGVQPKNELTVQQLGLLLDSIDKLRQLHESNAAAGLPAALGKPALAGIDVQCEAILRLEIAKRRGD